eukprot:Clim_evm8s249 gene=Clim_evmTU8s249
MPQLSPSTLSEPEWERVPEEFSHFREVHESVIKTIDNCIIKHDLHNDFKTLVLRIRESSCRLAPVLIMFAEAAPKCDYSEEIKGNGFRSCVQILEEMLMLTEAKIEQLSRNYGKVNFRRKNHLNRMQTLDGMLLQFAEGFALIEKPMREGAFAEGELFPEADLSDIIDKIIDMPKASYYSRYFGFHYPRRMKYLMRTLMQLMASYLDGHKEDSSSFGKQVNMAVKLPKYLTSYTRRSNKLGDFFVNGNVRQQADFWNLQHETVGIEQAVKVLAPLVSVNTLVKIPAKGFDVKHVNRLGGNMTNLFDPIPRKDMGAEQLRLNHFDEVTVRIMKHEKVKGMITNQKELTKYLNGEISGPGAESKLSPDLLFHMHGGGFIAQTSMSHTIYLRDYAKGLMCPIVSVDYTLSPKARFPQGLYECFYAYCWALDNAEALGSTAERVIITGDSAGGNFCFGLVQLCKRHGVRAPDSLVAAYPAMDLRYRIAPARAMTLFDPLLTTHALVLCMESYLGSAKSETAAVDPLVSPALLTDQQLREFPPMKIFGAEYDPLLDDAVAFSKRCKDLGLPISFEVVPAMCHGFLSLAHIAPQTTRGTNAVLESVKQGFNIDKKSSHRCQSRDDLFASASSMSLQPSESSNYDSDDEVKKGLESSPCTPNQSSVSAATAPAVGLNMK